MHFIAFSDSPIKSKEENVYSAIALPESTRNTTYMARLTFEALPTRFTWSCRVRFHCRSTAGYGFNTAQYGSTPLWSHASGSGCTASQGMAKIVEAVGLEYTLRQSLTTSLHGREKRFHSSPSSRTKEP